MEKAPVDEEVVVKRSAAKVLLVDGGRVENDQAVFALANAAEFLAILEEGSLPPVNQPPSVNHQVSQERALPGKAFQGIFHLFKDLGISSPHSSIGAHCALHHGLVDRLRHGEIIQTINVETADLVHAEQKRLVADATALVPK